MAHCFRPCYNQIMRYSDPKNNRIKRARLTALLAVLALSVSLILSGCTLFGGGVKHQGDLDLSTIPEWSGATCVDINDGEPTFTDEEMTTSCYESYEDLDDLGRCGTCETCAGLDLMPEGPREQISHIHPSGWHSDKYDFIEGQNLYNRSHLIAYSIAGENANECNLITGTRYMNAQGMLPFEEWIVGYIYRTGNHVMYRVTPIFKGDELIARGVHMEAKSVEDDGAGVSFNVYCYNVQPCVYIDYETGDNRLMTDKELAAAGLGTPDEEYLKNGTAKGSGWSQPIKTWEDLTESDGGSGGGKSGAVTEDVSKADYVVNTNTGKFHKPDCQSVQDMNPNNRLYWDGSRQDLIDAGYQPCGGCNP